MSDGSVRRQAAESVAMQINVRYEVRPDGGLVPVEAPGMESIRRRMAEALNSRCEAIMLGVLHVDGNAATRAAERGIEPVQPRDLWTYRHIDPLWQDPENVVRNVVAYDNRDERERREIMQGMAELQLKSPAKTSRELRYLQLRGNEQQPLRKLGEINAIMEAEGYLEVSGEGVMPCPTKSHEIVRENNGAKRMIEGMP